MLNVFTVTLNRYDLLGKMLATLNTSTAKVDHVYIVDRGGDVAALTLACGHLQVADLSIVTVEDQSLAAAWNWAVENISENRIITNDDVTFSPTALEGFVATPGDVVGMREDARSGPFACFLFRDSAREKVGLFDTEISPGYCYHEDCDYMHRMRLAGATLGAADGVIHGVSRTNAKKTAAQMADHHKRFRIAERNYMKKWGGLPGREKKR